MRAGLLYFHTIRHLKPVQIYSRLCPRQRGRLRSGAAQRREVTGPWRPHIERESPQTGPTTFRFLNQERDIGSWNCPGIPKLWLYNLHYIESPSDALIRNWIEHNPAGAGPGWEPYPLSLRLAHWIKWGLNGSGLPAGALESLATQGQFLSKRLEYHLLANHLFANAKALVFAGAFLAGADAERWLGNGLTILDRELSEQVLPDGGHLERSPMYHSLILEDVLDLVNLSQAFDRLIPSSTVDRWRSAASRMLGWLESMCHPDGRISFFNDSAFGVAPEPAQLRDYAGRLGIRASLAPLGESGYIRLENGETVVLFDAAPIGPDYQPAHAHADILSFELSHRGQRVVVNSGTSTYEESDLRQWQRGTSAHNTMRVDGLDQSELWRGFRVARRARPLEVLSDFHTFAEAAHDGYRRLKNPVTHRRRIELREGQLCVADRLEGHGFHEIEVFFHLHPGAQAEVCLDTKLVRATERTPYFPEFNLSLPNATVTGQWSGCVPIDFTTTIQLLRNPRKTECGANLLLTR